MHSFKGYISLFTELSEEDWANIEPCLSHKIIQENRIILKPGSVCKHLYFLENGAVSYFTFQNDKEEITNQINPPFLFTSVESFFQQIPSEEGIKAEEESVLWMISRDDVQNLMEIPSWKNFLSNL